MLYFVTNQYKQVTIQDWPTDMSGNKSFEKLTDEQVAFYEANPTASVAEVRKCELNPPYIPPVPSLSELIATAISNVSNMSLTVLSNNVSEYQLANAQVSILWAEDEEMTNKEQPIYDKEKAQSVIDQYLRIGKICRDEFYAIKPRLEACTTEDEINAIVAEAKEFYDAVE